MADVTESIWISAPAEVVYDLIADVGAVGRYSPEARAARGRGGPAVVGATFWGVNRRGPWVWVTRCRVTSADPGREFAFDVGFGPVPVSSWSYLITPNDQGGCTVVESWTDRREGVLGTLVRVGGSAIIPGPRDEHNRRNIRASLGRLKALAERGVAG